MRPLLGDDSRLVRHPGGTGLPDGPPDRLFAGKVIRHYTKALHLRLGHWEGKELVYDWTRPVSRDGRVWTEPVGQTLEEVCKFPINRFVPGQDISIAVGGAASHSAVVSEMVHGRVESVTEKVVKIIGDDGRSCWFPKAALVEPEKTIPGLSYDWFKLARWFQPNQDQQRWIERHTRVSGISALPRSPRYYQPAGPVQGQEQGLDR